MQKIQDIKEMIVELNPPKAEFITNSIEYSTVADSNDADYIYSNGIFSTEYKDEYELDKLMDYMITLAIILKLGNRASEDELQEQKNIFSRIIADKYELIYAKDLEFESEYDIIPNSEDNNYHGLGIEELYYFDENGEKYDLLEVLNLENILKYYEDTLRIFKLK